MATRLTTILVIVIVGATFIAGLIVGAQRDDANGPVDLIIVNGKVYPGAGAELQEAVAVRGNQILRVGSNRDVKRLRRAQTVVLDAHGGSVLPGLNDSHVEFMSGALALDRLDLSSASSSDELTSQLAEYDREDLSRPWLLGRNADVPLLSTPNVTARRLLDEAVPDRPVFIVSADQSIAWANTKALEKAGITRLTRVPRPGLIVKDRRSGEPSGVLKGSAIILLTRVLPEASHVEKILALRAAIEEAHRVGVTSVQTVNRSDEELTLLDEVKRQGDLTVRVYGSLTVSDDIDDAAVAALDKLRDTYPDDPALKVGGVEVACGCEPARLERAVALLDKHNWHVMVRAASEDDVHAALDAFEHAVSANPPPPRGRRFRLEDVEGIDPDDMTRLAQLKVMTEPADPDEAGAGQPLWNALSDAGARVLLGSNWPTAPLDPRGAIEETAVTDTPAHSARATRALIDAYTSEAAYASYDEQRKGRLAPGMLADIVILSGDIFQSIPGTGRDTTVAVTIFDGKVVYQRPLPSPSN
jgi:predicted amidohydrolase YtcJ